MKIKTLIALLLAAVLAGCVATPGHSKEESSGPVEKEPDSIKRDSTKPPPKTGTMTSSNQGIKHIKANPKESHHFSMALVDNKIFVINGAKLPNGKIGTRLRGVDTDFDQIIQLGIGHTTTGLAKFFKTKNVEDFGMGGFNASFNREFVAFSQENGGTYAKVEVNKFDINVFYAKNCATGDQCKKKIVALQPKPVSVPETAITTNPVSENKECKIKSDFGFDPELFLKWTGQCFGGYAQGPGTLIYNFDDRSDGRQNWRKIGINVWLVNGEVYILENVFLSGSRFTNSLISKKMDQIESMPQLQQAIKRGEERGIDSKSINNLIIDHIQKLEKTKYVITKNNSCKISLPGLFDDNEALENPVKDYFGKYNYGPATRITKARFSTPKRAATIENKLGAKQVQWIGSCKDGFAEGSGKIVANSETYLVDKMQNGSPVGKISWLYKDGSLNYFAYVYHGLWFDDYREFASVMEKVDAFNKTPDSLGLVKSSQTLLSHNLNFPGGNEFESLAAEKALEEVIDLKLSMTSAPGSPRMASESLFIINLDSTRVDAEYYLHWKAKPKSFNKLKVPPKNIIIKASVELFTKGTVNTFFGQGADNGYYPYDIEIPLSADKKFVGSGVIKLGKINTYSALSSKTYSKVHGVKSNVLVKSIHVE